MQQASAPCFVNYNSAWSGRVPGVSCAQRQRIAVQGNRAGQCSGATILDTFLSSQDMHTSLWCRKVARNFKRLTTPKSPARSP